MKDYLIYKNEISSCNICQHHNPPLIHDQAYPLFMKQPSRNYDILFVFETPNLSDTIDKQKGYLTVDPNTDPSGKLFYDLFTKELNREIEDLFVTNSVLCLPAGTNGKYPVTRLLRNNCKENLSRLIKEFEPLIVCSLGNKALATTKLLEYHKYNQMKDAAAKEINWYGRILFPLFHTSLLARNPRFGRPEELQREDWRNLRKLYNRLKE